jgi:hypothetical protein
MSIFDYNSNIIGYMENMDPQFPVNLSNTNLPSSKKITDEDKDKKFPNYEEKFGHLAEKIIRSALAKRNFAIEKVEKGTNSEDYLEKVDFWIQLKGLLEPLGIQYTTDPEKYKKKKDFLRQRNFLAHKEKRPDSEISWEGNANVVVILGDHAKMIEYWKKIENEGAKPEDVVSDAFIVDFFNKVLIEVGEANPPKKTIILEFFKNLARDYLKSKRAEK